MLEIVRMQEKDLTEVLEIENLSFKSPWSYNLFLKDVKHNPNSIFLVAKENDKIIGYGGFWQILDEMNIVNLAVHPDFRKKGIAKLCGN